MNKKIFAIFALAVSIWVIASLHVNSAAAQSGGQYDLTWSVLASGGTSTGGAYELSSAVGQPVTGAASGGAYTLAGGFWPAEGPISKPLVPSLYLPLIVR